MPDVMVPAGRIHYEDTGGDGPVVVLLHGLTMDHTLWRKVLPGLTGLRCVLPTLPLGGHRVPMRPDADLSLPGQAKIVADFLAALDLREVTLVSCDWGGGQLLVSENLDERVGKLVLVACEAFDNYPPKGAARVVAKAAKAPGALSLALLPLRSRFLRNRPQAWGGMTVHGIPDDVLDRWLNPSLTNPTIRRDLRKYVTSVPGKRVLLEWAERQSRFDRPVLVVWAGQDRLMPQEHGRRLAELFPRGRLVEIADSGTLVPEDQPEQLAEAIRSFVTAGDQDTVRR
ncbi:alpha/beta fold hydrolase [Actinokineospora iranica]|uniref:Pimeloyl-ACP methyl ester carboxylesterase n=1 Tax=Actinokineospora iranica TaxID=1271860 RepID=A0A1G6M341_9PSEU|nr:alpha/beta hydrolase [Actinokineospora iranica]SDC49962.1 Pimeloyl-ACP methyl ester carboxylesterase [Actinokineospora iranica]